MALTLFDLHYFPSIAYFIAYTQSEFPVIDDIEVYEKQTYKNRCRILGANGILDLSVPVNATSRKTPIRQVKIDYHQKWLMNHWRAISSAYGNAPFFEFYKDYFSDILFKKHQCLYDLNKEIMTMCLKMMRFSENLNEMSTLRNCSNEKQIVLRKDFHPRNKAFSEQTCKYETYQQVFGKKFVRDLSIIDLLFNEGMRSSIILSQSLLLI